MKKLVFFFPQIDKVGGVQVLFYRLIKKFIEAGNYEIIVVDYLDSYLLKRLQGLNFHHFPLDEERKIRLNKDHTLFTSPGKISSLLSFFTFSHNARLFLWEFGPYSFIENQILTSYYRYIGIEKATRISDMMEKKRKIKLARILLAGSRFSGIFFMCGKNYYYNKLFYRIEFEPNYLQIPVEFSGPLLPCTKKPKDETGHFNLFFMSRLELQKSQPLYRLIKNMSDFQKFQKKSRLKLIVIGDGPEKENLIKYSNELEVESNFLGRLEGEQLDQIITEKADLSFSMGTAALEFAKLRVPSVLTEGAMILKGDLKTEKTYKWLFDSNDYNLSSEPSLSSPEKMKKFEEILDEFFQIKDLSDKTFQYVLEKHNFDSVFSKINEQLLNNRLQFNVLIQNGIFDFSFKDNLLKGYLNLKRFVKKKDYH